MFTYLTMVLIATIIILNSKIYNMLKNIDYSTQKNYN